MSRLLRHVHRVTRRSRRRNYFSAGDNGYGTHAPFLRCSLDFLMAKSEKELTVFEVGTGGESSRIFQETLRSNDSVRLFSFENDITWSSKYRQAYPQHPRWWLLEDRDFQHWPTRISEELSRTSPDSASLGFIDSNPWESRIAALGALASADIFLIHDVDYFPHNGLFGREVRSIENSPSRLLRYGPLISRHLGSRDYGDIARSWIECFPRDPAYFTGPPTLVASNRIDVGSIRMPADSILLRL